MDTLHARLFFLVTLLTCSIAALAETTLITPSYAQISVESHSHTTGPPITPPPFQSTSTTIIPSNTGLGNGQGNPGQGNGQGNGRNGGVPPGLSIAWAYSNMSVVARAVTHAIFLNGTHGVELAQIAIMATSNGQVINNIAFNDSVVQIEFDHDGAVELDVNSSQQPMMIFADGNQLKQAPTNIGLTADSNTWTYDQNSHTLTIFADPSTITIFYPSQSTPVPEFPGATVTIALAIAIISSLAATVLVVTGKKQNTIVR